VASHNRVLLIGNLCRDPELKYLPSGTAAADLSLAVNDRVKKGDQWVDEPCYVDVVLFGRMAEVANEYAHKGSPLFIEGRLKFRSWEKDGQRRSKLEVVGEKMQLLGAKGAHQTTDEAQPAPPSDVPELQYDDEEIAF
jgi:single-strand DNA-binding protein